MVTRLVAVLGMRFPDLSVEESVLADADVRFVRDHARGRPQIVSVAGSAEVVMAGAAPRFDAETLAQLHCRAIVRYGVGVDSIDLVAARNRGMWVVNVPEYGTESVALHAMALALASLRRLEPAHRGMRSGTWGFAPLRPLHLPASLTAGVVGYGRIGRRVAGMLGALGFGRIVVTDPVAVPEPGGPELVSLDHLLESCDLVTLHCPPAEGGHPLLGPEELDRMKPGSILVNTARGALIDLEALAEALITGAPGTAALDVFPEEPPDLALFAPVIDRVLFTPHMAWYSEESELDLRRQAAAEARRVLRGERPLNVVVEPQEAEMIP